jgi:hypothetical protein
MLAHGANNFTMELLEEFRYDEEPERRRKEQEYIERCKPTLNSIRAHSGEYAPMKKRKTRVKDTAAYQKLKQTTINMAFMQSLRARLK